MNDDEGTNTIMLLGVGAVTWSERDISLGLRATRLGRWSVAPPPSASVRIRFSGCPLDSSEAARFPVESFNPPVPLLAAAALLLEGGVLEFTTLDDEDLEALTSTLTGSSPEPSAALGEAPGKVLRQRVCVQQKPASAVPAACWLRWRENEAWGKRAVRGQRERTSPRRAACSFSTRKWES